MRRRTRIALLCVLLAALLWHPVLKPAAQAALLIADIYSEQLVGTNLAALVTPPPRVIESNGSFAGVEMRVTYWRPGWGERHPAILVVPGATARGNEEPAMRRFTLSLARAGYMVMVPEFPFMKEGRFAPTATRQIDAAFAQLRARPETRGQAVGTFGVSVGGGMLLVAAGREPALRSAAFLSVLGGYYDLDTYLASLASRTQPSEGRLVAWEPSQEAQDRLPSAAEDLVPPSDRDAVRRALEPASYDEALGRIRALPSGARARFDEVSPEIVWSRIRPPIFWIHDPLDTFEPLAEAEAAAAAPREGRMALVVPRLVQHAAPVGEEAKRESPLYIVGELLRLATFVFDVLRTAG